MTSSGLKFLASILLIPSSLFLMRLTGWFGILFTISLVCSVLYCFDYAEELRSLEKKSTFQKIVSAALFLPQAIFGLIAISIGVSIVLWVLYNTFVVTLPQYTGGLLAIIIVSAVATYGLSLLLSHLARNKETEKTPELFTSADDQLLSSKLKQGWFLWAPRVISFVAFTIVYLFVYDAWQSSFSITECQKCRRANELSPMFLYLFVGTFALNYSFNGAQFSDQPFLLKRKLSVFNALWYALYLPGVVMCLWLFSNTFDGDLLVKATTGFLEVLLMLVAIFAGIISVLFLLSLPEKRQEAIAKTDYEKLPKQTIDDVLKAYQEFVLAGSYCRVYGNCNGEPSSTMDSITLSKIGGVPYAERNDSWPISTEPMSPSRFCIQLVLSDTELPPVWHGRLIVVFVVDFGVEVRSYATANASKAIDISNGTDLFEEQIICSKKVPIDKYIKIDEDGWADFDEGYTSAYALENNQPLKQRILSLSKYPEKFLDLLLENAGYPIHNPLNLIRQAPIPNLIQGPHGPDCLHCNQPLRFLFEFGEILEDEFTFGDGGVVYIYGCDQHPDYCQGFVDSH